LPSDERTKSFATRSSPPAFRSIFESLCSRRTAAKRSVKSGDVGSATGDDFE
jgi:hypothetical protein